MRNRAPLLFFVLVTVGHLNAHASVVDIIQTRLNLLNADATPAEGGEPSQGDIVYAVEHVLELTSNHIIGSVGRISRDAQSIAHNTQLTDDEFLSLLRSLSEALNQLPIDLSVWPAVRRAIIASVALRGFRQHQLTTDQESLVERLLVQCFLAHAEAARRKAVVEFAHVSKSGGTSICKLAQLNGCATESFSPNRNCLVTKFDDEPRYVNASVHTALRGRLRTRCNEPFKPMERRGAGSSSSGGGGEVSCKDRRAWLLARGFTAYANEYTALGGGEDPALAHPCRNMLTVLQLRNPHDRVVSHVKHMWHGYRKRCGDDRRIYFAAGHDTPHWAALLPAPTNNYLIRSLLGEAVFHLPPGAVTQHHLDLARAHLASQYDVLLVLEDSDLSGRAMRYGLGWRQHDLHVNGAAPDPEDGLPADLEALWRLNDLDLELYKYGVVLARLDAIMYDAVDRILHGGSSGDDGDKGGSDSWLGHGGSSNGSSSSSSHTGANSSSSSGSTRGGGKGKAAATEGQGGSGELQGTARTVVEEPPADGDPREGSRRLLRWRRRVLRAGRRVRSATRAGVGVVVKLGRDARRDHAGNATRAGEWARVVIMSATRVPEVCGWVAAHSRG